MTRADPERKGPGHCRCRRSADPMAMMSIEKAMGKAREHLQSGRFAEGEAICRAVLQGAPGEYEAHRILGLVAVAAGKSALAETHLRSALATRPDSAEVHNGLC